MSDAAVADHSETCGQCGFHSVEWNDLDTIRTIASAPTLVELWTESMTARDRDRRSAADRWSTNEYVDHMRETFFGLRALAAVAIETPGLDLGPAIDPSPAGPHRILDFAQTAAELATESAAFVELLDATPAATWSADVRLGGARRSVRWAARHLVHDFWHHLIDIADVRRELGDTPSPQHGSLAQINVSDGGLPKRPIDHAAVGRRGVVGDTQNARRHHGRPWQALCLWSAEAIADLQAEGHPIAAGNAGENFTISGIDWSTLRAGAVLDIGDVRCQLSAPAIPCAKNNRWFTDDDSKRILHDRHPGLSRWYASVITTGHVAPGDPVTVGS